MSTFKRTNKIVFVICILQSVSLTNCKRLLRSHQHNALSLSRWLVPFSTNTLNCRVDVSYSRVLRAYKQGSITLCVNKQIYKGGNYLNL